MGGLGLTCVQAVWRQTDELRASRMKDKASHQAEMGRMFSLAALGAEKMREIFS